MHSPPVASVSRLSTPSQASLLSEIEQEMGRAETARHAVDQLELEDATPFLPADSVLFPSRQPAHRRTTSSASAPGNARFSSSSDNNGAAWYHDVQPRAQYGAEADDEARSLKLGGSRPPSRLQSRQTVNRRLSTFSVASDSGSAIGYLAYLFPRGDGAASSSPGPMVDDNPPVGRDLARGRSVRKGKGVERSSRPTMSMYGVLENAPPVPRLPEAVADSMRGATPIQGESEHLDSEQAWYFLRTLVGEELKHEEGLLWKLTSLDAGEDMFAGQSGGLPADDEIDAIEVPILRYLIKHFLLSLPLIRDTSSENDSPHVPAFWSSGLQVLIRKARDADLSRPVDKGSQGLTSSIYDSFVRHALERFVSTGLKLSSGTRRAERTFEDAPLDFELASNSRMSYMSHPLSHNKFPQSSPNASNVAVVGPSYPTSPPSEPPLSPKFEMRDHIPSTPTSRRLSSGKLVKPIRPSQPQSPVPVKAVAEVPVSRLAPNPSQSTFVPFESRPRPPPFPPPPPPPTPPFETNRLSLSPSRSTARTGGSEDARYDSASFVSAHESETRSMVANDAAPPAPSPRPRVVVEPLPPVDPRATTTLPGLPADEWITWIPSGEPGFTKHEQLLFDPNNSSTNQVREQGGPSRRAATALHINPSAKPYTVDDDDNNFTSLRQGAPGSHKPYSPISLSASPTSPGNMSIAQKSSRGRSTSAQASTVPDGGVPSPPVEKKSRRLTLTSLGSFGSLLKKRSNKDLRSPSPVSPPIPSPSLPAFPSSPVFPTTHHLASPIFSHFNRSGGKLPRADSSPSPNQERSPFPLPHSTSVFANPLPTPHQGFAAMAIPGDVQGSRPVTSAPLAVELVQKSGTPWPFGAPVSFWRGAPYEKLKWGGFEADIVGVRSTLFSTGFLIRVRRPGRLDEYVVRNMDQFHKYFKVLERQFPNAHVRPVPASPKDEDAITPKLERRSSTTSSRSATRTIRPSASHSRLATALREAAEDPHSSGSRIKESSSSSSVFAKSLRAQSVNGDAPPAAARRRRATFSHAEERPRALSRTSMLSATTIGHLTEFDARRIPPYDPQRRALRNWLRDTLSVRTVGHHKETAAFLLLGPVKPREADVKDLRQREMVDQARRNARVGVAQRAAERVKTLHDAWTSVGEECIHGNGFSEISDALRNAATIEELPPRYVKSIEWLRSSLAETLYETLVASPTSGSVFAKLRSLHGAFPYFLVRQAFKISSPSLVTKLLQDILLARPFGSKSLLQKILATVLDDDPVKMHEQVSRYRSRIGSHVMAEKIEAFVYGDRERKEVVRTYARDNNLELVICILRGADEPRLSPDDLERVVNAGKSHRRFMKKYPSQLAKAQTDDSGVRLVLDLQMYLRLLSRDRDATKIREMLGDETTAEALEVVCGPIVELIKRTFKAGNAASALADLQKALDQLIIIVEALRSRVQEPQKAVRILNRLLGRHQHSLYRFLHSVHCGETIIDEFIQWGWTASVFLRRGLAQPVNIDDLIPEEEEDRSFLIEEVQDVVEYHRQKRLAQYQNACRRYAGDLDADDPVIIEGDGHGKSQVEPHVEAKPKMPFLDEIPYCTEAFRRQLRNVFAV